MLVAANAAAVVGLWWRQGGLREVHDIAGLLTSLGRVTGLLGALLALVELLLLARIPVLDASGLERVGTWHRVNGTLCLALIGAHTLLTTAGYALTDDVPVTREAGDLLTGYSGVLLATIALALLVAVVITSVVSVRRRLSYRVWHAVHVGAYVAIALGFSHQLATGHEFLGQPLARAYWWALYAATLAALVGFRVVLPVARSLRHRLRIERVVPEAPGVVSLEIGGVDLDRLRVLSGQSLHWRFLARGHWWETHPFSLSAAPDGRRLRITVKELGDYTRRLASLPPGTRVIVEGPSGGLTSAARRHPRVALIAGGWASRRSGRCWRTPRASRGRSPSSTARRARTTSSFATSSTSSRAGAAPSCTTSWVSAAATRSSRPSTCRRWCPTSPAATSTSAARAA